MTLYGLLKYTHVTCVVISGVFFSYRFYLLQRHPHRPLSRILKVAPHFNDTVLLAAAIGMLILAGMNPFNIPWLSAKLVLLLVYIGLGTLCLRASAGSSRQIVLFALAAMVYASIVAVALSKKAVFIG